MLTYTQALILGLFQGVTELFPISSLGHTVLIPALLHWNTVDEHSPAFVLFIVATHVATALVLLAFFWREWIQIILGFFRILAALFSKKSFSEAVDSQDTYARLAWLILIATIPAGIIGFIFQNALAALFAAPTLVAIVLVLNGLLLHGIELTKQSRMRFENLRNTGDAAIVKLSWPEALLTGLMQSLALIPGFSRTGSSLAGGLLAGLDHESAARFSFLLATPIILAAGLLRLPGLFHASFPIAPILFGAVVAAAASFVSVKFLLHYFKTNTLRPFAWYCIVVGIVSLFLLTH
jgi:undecaprenyl-diphosphatase